MKKRRPKIELSKKQIEKIKKEVCKDATARVMILAVASAADEFKLSEDQICNMAKRMGRYAEHLDEKRLKLKEMTDIIEKKTGLKLGGLR